MMTKILSLLVLNFLLIFYTISCSSKTIAFVPGAPSNLVATTVPLSHIDLISSQINLTWTDNSNNEQGFKIEIKLGANGTFTQVATASSNITSYLDTNLYPTANYYYRVKAYNKAGDSDYSNIDGARTFAPTSPPPAEARVCSAPSMWAIFEPVNWKLINISILETPTPYQCKSDLDNEPYVDEMTQGTLTFAYADISGNCIETQRSIHINNYTKNILCDGLPVTTLGDIFHSLPVPIGSDSVTLVLEFSYHLTVKMEPVSTLPSPRNRGVPIKW